MMTTAQKDQSHNMQNGRIPFHTQPTLNSQFNLQFHSILQPGKNVQGSKHKNNQEGNPFSSFSNFLKPWATKHQKSTIKTSILALHVLPNHPLDFLGEYKPRKKQIWVAWAKESGGWRLNFRWVRFCKNQPNRFGIWTLGAQFVSKTSILISRKVV